MSLKEIKVFTSSSAPLTKEEPLRFPKLKILIAEDNAVSALVLKTMLTREGYTVDVVTDGQQAFQAV